MYNSFLILTDLIGSPTFVLLISYNMYANIKYQEKKVGHTRLNKIC